ncbi:Uncharacterized protein BP5553_08452 [Venustampulla echinocandica]|uniref:TLC domain-containing protein n=1 Tax=Venustampulla echinocandica TaxID=2656787 RepID=A0A370TE98_9HELO|nr:Uncharacterized protein BP5553_08452 [Venustampulla echinocandica]RDL33013.1 Uncharacterized protein BP5553_08452 [Venustampulla echinocandica]
MVAPDLFPLLNTSADQPPSATRNSTPRRRRKSSILGQEICAADTGRSLGIGLSSIIRTSDSSSTKSSSGHARQLSEQKRLSKRGESYSLLRRCTNFAIKHTWTIPLVLLLAILSLYAINPTESNAIHHFIFLSYRLPLEAGADPSSPPQYGKGLWDIAFVSFYVIVLSFTREFIMQEILRPLARFCGIKAHGKQFRFMEQAYTAIYFGLTGPAGLYVMRQTPVWYFDARGMFEFFPHKTHQAVFKFYYLFQAAYWAQQAVVMLLGMEKRRKDFNELVAHHIVTLTLVGLSYRFHFTYIGIAIYITHDISDFFLALSKSLHYIDSPMVGLYFGTSIGAWIYLRHYLNIRIFISLFNEFRTVGPYEMNWETGQYKSPFSNTIAIVLLGSLQSLNLFWLYCLLRSAFRFVVYNVAKDDRSDTSEDEELELEDIEPKKEETKKVEALPLLSGNGFANGSANGVMKATGNGTATLPPRRKSARKSAL